MFFFNKIEGVKNWVMTSYFHTTKKNPKNILACILVLITSLLKSRELDQYFKKSKKIFCFVLVSGITNLYIKCISDIKKVVLLLKLGLLGFTRHDKDLFTEKDFS
jgi:hypothetical protein